MVEIGPGTGMLTAALLACGANVTALEIDPQMVEILHARRDLESAELVAADALRFDYERFEDRPWRVAGNLPYNIATPLLLDFIERPRGPESLVVMVQKDVADRFVAKPNSAAYGSLSVAVQFAMEVERLFTLGPDAFYPRPKVHSTVVRLRRRARPAVDVRDVGMFVKVVRAAFAYRRKTLANSLSLALGVERTRVQHALRALALQMEIRGEQLSLEDFAALADELGTEGI